MKHRQLLEDKYRRIRDQGMMLLQSETDAQRVYGLEQKIRSQFSLHSQWHWEDLDIRDVAAEELLALDRIEGLANVFMFHGDGRIREQALHRLQGPVATVANVNGLFVNLNHWAAEVRDASHKAMDRVLPSTSATIIAPALKAILPNVQSWGRWANEGPQAINAILIRPDVASVLLHEIKSTRQSGLGLIFRELSKMSWIDPQIESIFRSAPLPHIRAMAFNMLLSRKARWPSGESKRVWINRPLDKYRIEPIFVERALNLEIDDIKIIEAGATDRSAMVRRHAADGLITLRNNAELAEAVRKIATTLRSDPNIGVRSRIDFFFRSQDTRLNSS